VSPAPGDPKETEGGLRALGSHGGFQLFAHRQSNGWWRIVAVFDVKDGDGSSPDRTALVVEDPSIEVAERTIRERVDRWRGGSV
jgi:hypothetical protein